MKLLLCTCIAACSYIMTALSAMGQSSDNESIKQALQAGWAASTSKNAEGIKAAWKQDAMVVNTFIGRYNQTRINSWDSISSSIDRNFKANPKPNRSSYTLRNHKIRSNGTMAFVEYDAIVTPINSDPNSFPYIPDSLRFHSYQVLEKDNNQWKTIALINTDPESYVIDSDHAIESDINEIGYRYLAVKKYNEAIEVFKTNIKLFPNAWNTYDSLGEAYMLSGNKKLAIENYERSLKLNPKSESGKEALAKLKQL